MLGAIIVDHRLDVVSVRIENERAVVARVVLGPATRPAEVPATGSQRRCVEGVDVLGRPSRKADVHWRDGFQLLGRLETGDALPQPKLRLLPPAEADAARASHDEPDPEWGECRLVEGGRALGVRDVDADVIQYG